jgi:hypothetical protein
VFSVFFLFGGGRARGARLTREFKFFWGDHFHAPVVTVDELKSQYLFTKKDAVRALGFLGITIVLYFLVFTYQKPILTFLSGEGWKAKAIACTAVFLFTPLVAYLYGSVTKSFMKLIRME